MEFVVTSSEVLAGGTNHRDDGQDSDTTRTLATCSKSSGEETPLLGRHLITAELADEPSYPPKFLAESILECRVL
jgi:hypothetical protein